SLVSSDAYTSATITDLEHATMNVSDLIEKYVSLQVITQKTGRNLTVNKPTAGRSAVCQQQWDRNREIQQIYRFVIKTVVDDNSFTHC
ncbi:hypothetical protein GJ496_001335, partial [Pomphorhynchus laevis]